MKFKTLYRRALVWIGIQKQKPEQEIIDLIKKNIKFEEQLECEHKMLSALFPGDIWYRCTNGTSWSQW